MNNIKMLRCRFQQCLGMSAMWLVEASSETRLFGHLSTHVFGVRNFRNTKAIRVFFFSRSLKINLDFKNATKISEKVFFVSEIIACELVLLNCLY